MAGEWASDRTVLEIRGTDALRFLQDLVTNDLKAVETGLVYAALLSPQGKYLFDFFLSEQNGVILLDVNSDRAQALEQRLNMYRLRADVQITRSDLVVNRGLGNRPKAAHRDPRHRDLGWREYAEQKGGSTETVDWDAIRVANCIPETGIELKAEDSYILEAGFERLSGVDFRKGCYVGQEVTARMKHKTELRKGLVCVDISGTAPVGTEITSQGKPVGRVFTQSGGKAIAYLRFDRAGLSMKAGEAEVSFRPVSR